MSEVVRGQQQAPASRDAGADELWREFKDGRSNGVREALFHHYRPFAHAIARRQHLKTVMGDIDLDDLKQLACAGLLEAIDRFDLGHGAPFREYAAPRIKGSVLDGLSKMNEVRQQIAVRNRLRQERARSLLVHGAESLPTADAMQALADLAVAIALGIMLEGTSQFVRDGQVETKASAYDTLAWREATARLHQELARLPPRETLILRRHYLDGVPFQDLATEMALTKGRVSQIHRAALLTLRKRLSKDDDLRFEF